ncbi:diguanylate cyclase [Parasporobacterium paucivorans]|uniref:PAS domain S-box-containing protein/diguanylate cyclase (GGDEF) domain-containing protein n=1 Tax=Parasporobacterium paucivorans DSM 15970 TaxID=1122934 RepID=A0A1M6IQJ5_9FIRM|nr:diguanylate cyclase [Parasporobacterium paucivorans]SHJ36722.1 PAS domain S-box-containing protein/diguanylate cyclase (GGDEF) domain-containing protein [Parasporobacterium paucivorans DSM 15970]
MIEEYYSMNPCYEYLSTDTIAEWQSIIDLVTRLSNARVGLIMRVISDKIEVFVASNKEGNPYKINEKECLHGSGLYCERVIKTQSKLLVSNALKSDEWNHNPDLKHNLVAYLGFPIRNPDGSLFGTICLLDDKENQFSDDLIELMSKMRNMIEGHLRLERLRKQNAEQINIIHENNIQLDHANHELMKSEERYRLITENISDVIWVLNLNKKHFTYISPSIEQLRGYTVEEAMAEKMEEALTPSSVQFVMEKLSAHVPLFIKDPKMVQSLRGEVQQPCKNGEIIWVEVTLQLKYNTCQEIEIIGVSRNIEKRKKTEKEVLYLSTHDYLTGCYNRAFFEKRAEEELERSTRYHKPISFLMLDLDFFKKINDTYGHIAGDGVLKKFAETINAILRSSDIFARFGGEEFIVLIPETTIDGAVNVAEKICSAIENTVQPMNEKITVSIGVVERNADESLDDLYRRVDQQLYQAKASGRNRVVADKA